MSDNRRWYLTDFQRLVVALLGGSAVFLAAMSLGMGSFALLLIAVGIVVVAGLGVFLLGLRYNSRPSGPGTAYVITAPVPPIGKIVARCDMLVLLDMPGARSGRVKLRDPSAPTAKWPRTGDVLPTDIDPRTRHVRIRWDRADPSQYRGRPASPTTPATPADNSDEPLVEYAPTPPASYPVINAEVLADPMPPVTNRPTSPARSAKVFLDEDPALGPAPGGLDDAGTRTNAGTDMDMDMDMDTDADTVRVSPTVPEQAAPISPAPGGPSIDDLDPPADPTSGDDLPTRIPQPRLAGSSDDGPAREPDGYGQVMGGMLLVADLARSVAFYRDKLDFRVVDETPGGAVLNVHGGRMLLQRRVDMSPVERRLSHLLFSVSDVDATYAELRSRGVEFLHRPKLISRVGELELWGATVRDPDGHAIALAQWRDRADASR